MFTALREQLSSVTNTLDSYNLKTVHSYQLDMDSKFIKFLITDAIIDHRWNVTYFA